MGVVEELKVELEGWLSESFNNNLNILAVKTRIPYSSLYRISKGLVSSTSIENVDAILRVTSTQNKRLEILKKAIPQIAKDIAADSFANDPRARSEHDLPSLDTLLDHPVGFSVGQLLLSHCGVTKDKIKRLHGMHGWELIEPLLEDGTVEEKDGVYKIPGLYVCQKLQANLKQIKNAADLFKARSADVGAGYIRTLSEGVSVDAAQKIKALIHACAVEVMKTAEENPGEHVFVASFMCQLVDPETAISEMGGN